MAELFDADGNVVEALTKDEAETLAQQKADELLKQKQEEFKQKEEELEKLKTKDYNWQKLRAMTKEEKEKMKESERAILEKQEELDTKFNELESSRKKEVIDTMLEAYAGDDEELRKKILINYDRIKDPDADKESIKRKMKDAFILSNEGRTINPVNRAFVSSGSYYKESKRDDFAETDRGKELAKTLGLNFVKGDKK